MLIASQIWLKSYSLLVKWHFEEDCLDLGHCIHLKTFELFWDLIDGGVTIKNEISAIR